ncbi:MAG: hypothetical protein KGH58_01825 [Candidatus Micrarchaeota archaeon]|nr:hypothetical protein [Candidatus Micrarchaeota archaeon]
MNKRRGFSLYDMEQFFRDVGAEKVNEKAVVSMERELQETVRELVEDASIYASYAGRNKLIKHTDVLLAARGSGSQGVATRGAAIRNRIRKKRELSAASARKRALDRMVAVSVSRPRQA